MISASTAIEADFSMQLPTDVFVPVTIQYALVSLLFTAAGVVVDDGVQLKLMVHEGVEAAGFALRKKTMPSTNSKKNRIILLPNSVLFIFTFFV
jgi:hypothetical protein